MSRVRVTLGGILGEALAANHRGRLSRFIVDESSPAIALFDPARAEENREGDWYGEHAGKWLAAAARAAARTVDATLAANVRRVADYLVSIQRDDGYLGTYAPERRFTRKPPPPQPTWDGAPGLRTWDLWTHSYLVLGLLEAWRFDGAERYLRAATRIGDLCRRVLVEEAVEITHLGNHHGMSATVLMDAAMELHFATGEARFLELARHVLERAEARPELRLLSKALAGADASEIGTGKAYQLCWNLVALAKMHRATGEGRLLAAVMNVWESIRTRHLTLGGGPWGGVAHRSREVFNAPGAFSPEGYVETCSTFSWMQLNRELHAITGEARFAEEIERSAYNDLLGAQAPDGEDWIYYSFPNGRRVFTTYWRCCKSSGAMALEELPLCAYTLVDGALTVNLYGPGAALVDGLRIEQATRYPFEGEVRMRVSAERPLRLPIRLRIPSWAAGSSVEVNGSPAGDAAPGTYLALEREWREGDEIVLRLPMAPAIHRQALRNVQESIAPDGRPVAQEVLHHEYAAITRGPLVYATTLIDGFKTQETVWLDDARIEAGNDGRALRLELGYRAPLAYAPYYEAGGRSDGSWRLTWLALAPRGASAPERPPAPPPATPRGKP